MVIKLMTLILNHTDSINSMQAQQEEFKVQRSKLTLIRQLKVIQPLGTWNLLRAKSALLQRKQISLLW